ncbi:MAG: EAL domain-containing protein [Actinomycetota bacterium]
MDGFPKAGSDDSRIGEIAARRTVHSDGMLCSEADVLFRSHAELRSLLVQFSDGVHLITRSDFHEALSGRLGFGHALYADRPLSAIPRRSTMIVSAETPCEYVTQQILNDGHATDDEVLVQLADGYGTVPVAKLLDHLWNLSRGRARRLETEGRRLHALVDHASDVTLVIDRHGALRWANLAQRADFPFANILDGVHRDDIPAAWEKLARAISGSEVVDAEFRFRFHAEEHRLFSATFRGLVSDPAVRGIVVTMRDIEDERRAQAHLIADATTDSLTGLANRPAIMARIEKAVAEGDRPTLMMIDLDAFKVINDRFGDATGDAVLQEVSRRLRATADYSHTVARLDGDRFAIAACDILDDHQFGNRARDAIGMPIEIGDASLRLSATIGLATMTSEQADAATLAEQAALALKEAKDRGRNNVVVFEPAMETAARERDAMRGRLRVALATGAFSLVYQPQMCLTSAQPLRGFEALIRWPDPSRGSIPPDEFIPLAEESGEIVEIGRWVLSGALDQLLEWHRFGAQLTMAVNTSVRELAETDFAPFVRDELERRHLDPSLLEIEITETALATDDVAVMETLGQLRDLGVGIAVDDYGSGHASIAYLRRYPISTIKVDRTLVAMLDQDQETASALLRSITDVARALGLRSVVEGLETAAQTEHARNLGFDLGQGWHCGMPMSALRASKLVAVARRDDSAPRTDDNAPDLASFEASLAAFDGSSPEPSVPEVPEVVTVGADDGPLPFERPAFDASDPIS